MVLACLRIFALIVYIHSYLECHEWFPGGGGGGGGLAVYMTGGSDIFFWIDKLPLSIFGGSKGLSQIF